MSTPITIAASILSANLAHLGNDVKKVLSAGADAIHFDVMDHHFVKNLTFGPAVCEALRNDGITAEIDVHLMVTDPEIYIEAFAKAGANRLSFHPETVTDVIKTCEKIHAAGMEVGLAFNPDKAVNIPEEVLKQIDLILIMSVFAGFGGQAFIPESLGKIVETKKLIEARNPTIKLAVDGGIKVNNFLDVVSCGANFIVIGSGLFEADDYKARINELRGYLKHARKR